MKTEEEIQNYEIAQLLRLLRIPFRELTFAKHLPNFYIIETFGTIITAVDRADEYEMQERFKAKFPGYNYMFVYMNQDFAEAKYNLIWDLARLGYVTYLRSEYESQFYSLITTQDFGTRLIKERLRIWNNKSKYRFLIEQNETALEMSFAVVLTQEPAFFDYMPTEESEETENN